MALSEYKNKRSFRKTPEPTGGKPSSTRLAFVVQKYHASHLHYDFCLEMHGVLKSWAVPKGPSMKPKEKRLAMLVEDHPYNYKDFEGIIPKGNYGAGSVIVWDNGWYEPAQAVNGKKAQENELIKQLYTGRLDIKLHGKKLKGTFSLVKNSERGETYWLLTKIKDDNALTTDITAKDESVLSGKTVEEIAQDRKARKWQSNREPDSEVLSLSDLIKKGRKSPMPHSVRPMLATKAEGIQNNENYLYEVKWDGYRILSFVKKGKVHISSRGAQNYTDRYPVVVDALKALGHDAILDGEMVVFDKEGNPKFNAVQLYNGHDTPISYFVFDILYLDGYNLKELPLVERKEILKRVVEGNEVIRLSESFDDGEGLYRLMAEKGWEGVVAKKRDSAYIEDDRRSYRWLKFPVARMDEFVIGGWAESDKARSFRSILFGAYNAEGELTWLGRSGGGYKEEEMPGILKKIQKFSSTKCPFTNKVLDTKGAVIHWVKPQLVANFAYAEMTESGRIRKPATWKGFREDKNPKDVMIPLVKKFSGDVGDETAPTPKKEKQTRNKNASHSNSAKGQFPYLNKNSGWKKVDEEQEGAEWQDFPMEHCTIPVHNLERELWEGVPKGRILIYYSQMAEYILPYLKGRPQSLNLKLTHAGAPRVFIKDMENRQPDCAEVFVDKRRHETEGKRAQIDYLVCNNLETLMYMADLGCVDINPWASRVQNIDEPDYLSIDLDPTIPEDLKGKKRLAAEDKGFEKAVEVAIAAKKVFDKHKLQTFIKTSGQTGLHIFIPCSGFAYEQPRQIAFKLAKEIQAAVPRIGTVQDSKDLRGDKVFIDTTLNDYADTLASAYSIRPYHHPLVSTPVEWKEVQKGLDRYAFTMNTIKARLKKKGDLWKGIFDESIVAANNKVLSKLQG